EVDEQAAGRGHHLAVDLHAQLTLGKMADLALELLPQPRLHAGKTLELQVAHLLVVRRAQRPHQEQSLDVFSALCLRIVHLPPSSVPRGSIAARPRELNTPVWRPHRWPARPGQRRGRPPRNQGPIVGVTPSSASNASAPSTASIIQSM